MMRAVLGESQLRALFQRRTIVVFCPGHPNVELILADIRPERVLELLLAAMDSIFDQTQEQEKEFLSARQKK